MTAGDKGSAALAPANRRDQRVAAQNGADIPDTASYRCLECSDLEICFDNLSRRRVLGVLRKAKRRL